MASEENETKGDSPNASNEIKEQKSGCPKRPSTILFKPGFVDGMGTTFGPPQFPSYLWSHSEVQVRLHKVDMNVLYYLFRKG